MQLRSLTHLALAEHDTICKKCQIRGAKKQSNFLKCKFLIPNLSWDEEWWWSSARGVGLGSSVQCTAILIFYHWYLLITIDHPLGILLVKAKRFFHSIYSVSIDDFLLTETSALYHLYSWCPLLTMSNQSPWDEAVCGTYRAGWGWWGQVAAPWSRQVVSHCWVRGAV